MGIKIKHIILILIISCNTAYPIDTRDMVNTLDKNFKSSKKEKSPKKEKKVEPVEEENILDLLSKEIWASFDAQAPSKIHARDLKKILKTKKISYIKSSQSYTGMMDYVDGKIDQQFTNYLMWVIIIQSFVVILFIILYIELSWKINNKTIIKEKVQEIKNIIKDVPLTKKELKQQELRKLFS